MGGSSVGGPDTEFGKGQDLTYQVPLNIELPEPAQMVSGISGDWDSAILPGWIGKITSKNWINQTNIYNEGGESCSGSEGITGRFGQVRSKFRGNLPEPDRVQAGPEPDRT